MKENAASRTAEYMALFRALESYKSPGQRLFEDRFAYHSLRSSLRVAVQFSRFPFLGKIVSWIIDRKWPGVRTSGVARTRVIDDALKRALENTMDQLVILGAGFDSRAYRLTQIAHVRVYEVDHPQTMFSKRVRLRTLLDALPVNVEFVEIDFNHQSLQEAMQRSTFDFTKRSFFIWEGVSNYVSEEAVDATLRFISSTAAGNELIFTYIHRGVLDDPRSFEGTENVVELLRREKEPWTFGIYPAELATFLKTRGFELIEDVGSVDYRARYWPATRRNLKGYEFYRIAHARVSGMQKQAADHKD